MKMVKGEPNFGPSGAATIKVVGKQLQVIFDEGNEVVNLNVDLLPPEVDAKKLPTNKKYSVMVDAARSKLTGFRPFAGSYIAEFVELKKKPGQPPIHEYPRKREGMTKDGRPYPKDWHEFKANVRLVEAPFTGLIVPITLRYYFGMDSEDGSVIIAGEGQHSQYLARFIEVNVGDLEKVKIPFSDNILPQLEALLLREKRPFLLVMNNGFADSFGEAPAAYRKAAKKAPAKKAVKKAATKK